MLYIADILPTMAYSFIDQTVQPGPLVSLRFCLQMLIIKIHLILYSWVRNPITQLTLCYILQTFCPQWPIPLLIRPCNQDRWSHSSVQPLAIPHQELRGPWMAIPCRKMIGKQLFENIAPFKTKFCKQKRTKVNSLSPKKWTFWSIKI